MMGSFTAKKVQSLIKEGSPERYEPRHCQAIR